MDLGLLEKKLEIGGHKIIETGAADHCVIEFGVAVEGIRGGECLASLEGGHFAEFAVDDFPIDGVGAVAVGVGALAEATGDAFAMGRGGEGLEGGLQWFDGTLYTCAGHALEAALQLDEVAQVGRKIGFGAGFFAHDVLWGQCEEYAAVHPLNDLTVQIENAGFAGDAFRRFGGAIDVQG